MPVIELQPTEPGVTLRFDPEREEAELRAYLGDAFTDRARLERYPGAARPGAGHRRRRGASSTAPSQAYLLQPHRVCDDRPPSSPTSSLLTRHVPPGCRVLDYGCGIGSDGLLLLEAGYQVEFADFDNPSTAFLRWRLRAASHLDAPVHDLDAGVPGGFDAAYSFDVIEHVPDPYAFLGELERRAGLVEVNLLEFDPNEQELHYRLPSARCSVTPPAGSSSAARSCTGPPTS